MPGQKPRKRLRLARNQRWKFGTPSSMASNASAEPHTQSQSGRFGSLSRTRRYNTSAINSAMGDIRREVGHRLGLRKTPELKFVADDSIEHGMNIARMLDDLKEDEDAN